MRNKQKREKNPKEWEKVSQNRGMKDDGVNRGRTVIK